MTGVESITLNVTSVAGAAPSGAPWISNFAVYSCGALAAQLDQRWLDLGYSLSPSAPAPYARVPGRRPWIQ